MDGGVPRDFLCVAGDEVGRIAPGHGNPRDGHFPSPFDAIGSTIEWV